MSKTPPALLYYISGHGFGHANRCAQTIRELTLAYPELQVHVRTQAAAGIFADMGPRVHFAAVPIDRGCVEKDALNLDWPATLTHVRELLAGKDRFIRQEVDYIRQHRVGLIIADVPFMAGYVAEAAGVACYAQCNFMWDWIYQQHTQDAGLLQAIAGGYQRMAGWLRLPFPHECAHFPQIEDVPFICSPPSMTPAEALGQLRINPGEKRPRVLVAMRGGIAAEIFPRLQQATDYLFIAPGQVAEDNIYNWPAGMRFWDVMQVCDVVVSKPGHGIVTDCATLGVGLLWPARNGFREDAMILGEGKRYFRCATLAAEDFASGCWQGPLAGLLQQQRPRPASNTNGAAWMAAWIGRKMGLSHR